MDNEVKLVLDDYSVLQLINTLKQLSTDKTEQSKNMMHGSLDLFISEIPPIDLNVKNEIKDIEQARKILETVLMFGDDQIAKKELLQDNSYKKLLDSAIQLLTIEINNRIAQFQK